MCKSIKHLHSLVGNVKSTWLTTPLATLASSLEVPGWMTEFVTLVWDELGFGWVVDCWESEEGLELSRAEEREVWDWFVEGGLELGWARKMEGWNWLVDGGSELGCSGWWEGWDWFVEGGLELGWTEGREGWLGLVTPGVGMDSGLGLDPEMKNKTKNLNQPFELPLK